MIWLGFCAEVIQSCTAPYTLRRIHRQCIHQEDCLDKDHGAEIPTFALATTDSVIISIGSAMHQA